MSGFVHLHVHSEYSLLDGACRIPQLVARTKEMGQSAVAITDHGCMYGAIEFYQEAKKAGIHPIIGCEVYVAPRGRFDKVHQLDSSPYHLVLLCKNQEGYQNLIHLVSCGYLEGFYGKPRIDWELLEAHSAGLICLSGCLAGEIPRRLRAQDYAGAKEIAYRYQALFGAENYYLEIQNHGLQEQLEILPFLYRLSAETGIPLVATNDAHYIEKTDAEMQHVLLCIQTNKTVQDSNAMRFGSDEFYLKSSEEMIALFPNAPAAISNTERIAAQCQLDFTFGEIKLPKFEMAGVTDTTAFFRQLCTDGMRTRYGETPGTEATERLAYELDVIVRMGYVDYFLIVWDFIRYAREQKIPVGPGRGSGAGSICAYCIGITGIDPLRYHLLFERFLNPERVSMPDFDIDFCIEGRQRVIDYVVRKYGSDRVAQIIAFDTMKAKGAIRDTGRALGLPYALCDQVARLISGDPQATLQGTLDSSKELSALYLSNPQVHTLLDMAKRLEGMPRHASMHAAGVVIASAPVDEFVPLQKNDESVVTQYTMTVLEQLGLLKMDFLGLRNLTVIRDCVAEIHKQQPNFNLDAAPLDDVQVYQMLTQGNTQGVFQFESSGMRSVLMRLVPDCIEDLIAVLSLYRPGPMDSIPRYIANRHTPARVTYAHPLLEPILRVTYGCIVYQEQVMEICRALAGYSYGRADLVRRAMAKKKHTVMEEERKSFVYGDTNPDGSVNCVGAVANGVPETVANGIFDEMTSFASYAFNKSHAAAYAYLAYQTAYLKCHFFAPYLASLMTSVLGNTSKLLDYIAECEANGVPVRKPNVNISMSGFTTASDGIHFGLLAIKGMGTGVVAALVRERTAHGAFHGFSQFCERMMPLGLNKRGLESLIRAGALDGLDCNRRQMLTCYETLLDSINNTARQSMEGQLDLFGNAENRAVEMQIPPLEEFPVQELLRMEKEMTGLYLSGHPLSSFAWMQQLLRLPTLSEAAALPENTTIQLFCMLQEIKKHQTKTGGLMCFLTLEDLHDTLDAVVFPDLYATVAQKLQTDTVFCITGRISKKEDRVSLLCSAIRQLDDVAAFTQGKRFCIKLAAAAKSQIEQVLAICRRNPGAHPYCLYLTPLQKYMLPKIPVGIAISESLCQTLQKEIPSIRLGLIEAV